MATGSQDVDDIRRQMAMIRRELHEDVREVVATAEAATDWKRYIAGYPWVALGVAFAVGYFIVPKRRRVEEHFVTAATQLDAAKLQEVAAEAARRAAAEVKGVAADPKKRRKTLIGAALGMVVPLALRAAQSYAAKYVEQWVAQQQDLLAHFGPPPAPGGADRPQGPGQGPGAAGPGRQPGPGFGQGPGPGPGTGPGQRPRPAGGPGGFF